ncbi:MAG: hypothetical protein APF76_10205 [Desulfitibacter sp. BRH_c19]|nr:MAG: hypothetical protein APF76_10205 [Desulfitibacter sp. BRH_c19]
MPINQESLLDILRAQVIPALGCTEPIAVALAAARAREELGAIPDKMSVFVSLNIYKNSMGVYIPGTQEKGIYIAAALGMLVGISSLKLQVLEKIEESSIMIAKQYIEQKHLNVTPVLERKGIYIKVEAIYEEKMCEVVIEGKHDHILSVKLNGQLVENFSHISNSSKSNSLDDLGKLKISQLMKIIKGMKSSELEFLLNGVEMNRAIAKAGLKNKLGLAIGTGLNELIEDGILGRDLISTIRIQTASAADARMNGLNLPVMTSGGSGNQGIVAILPIALAAEHYNIRPERLAKAIALSHILNVYIKQYTGSLSAVCGCAVAAGAGASAAIAWMLDGTDDQIAGAIKNIVGNLCGMICDGAKASCAFKLSTASTESILAAELALKNVIIAETDGIISSSAEETIMNLGEICAKGMDMADKTIMEVMMRKPVNCI